MRNTRKIFVALLVVLTLLMSMAVVASAAKTTSPTTLVLTPNANWKADNARFAAYTWDGGDQWFDMTDTDGDGVYECTIPAGIENIIFCRMNPSASANNWNNKWNQTADLVYDGTNNHYTVKEGTWDKGGGTWSFFETGECVHAPSGEGEVTKAATCTENGEIAHTCSKCGEGYTIVDLAKGHSYGADGICTTCSAEAVYIIAGDVMRDTNDQYVTGDNSTIFVTSWDVTDEDNKLVYDADLGAFVKVYNGVAAGEYHFKVTLDKSWGVSYGANGGVDNCYIKVASDGSTVTITFKNGVPSASVKAHEHTYTYPCDKVCNSCFEESNPDAVHTIVAVEAKAATCYENGNIAYWYCSDCGYAWADEALTQQTNQMNVIVPMAHAPATHVAAKDATCTENGNIEYWYCEACGQAWLDEACTLNTNLLSVVLPAAHNYADGKCTVCGEADPDYEAPAVNNNVIDFSQLEEFPKGTYTDGAEQKYNDIFTFYHGNDSRIDGSNKSFEDGFAGTLRFGFGGKWKTVDGGPGRGLQINAPAAGTITLWWVSGGDGRSVDLLNASFEVIETTGTDIASGSLYITTFEIPAEGVYYLTNIVNNNYWFKVEYAEKTEVPHEHVFVDGKCECGAEDPNYVPPHVNTLVVGDTNKIVIGDSAVDNGYGYLVESVLFTAAEKAHYEFTGEGLSILVYDLSMNNLCGFTGKADLEAGTYIICIASTTPGTKGEFNVAVSQSAIAEPDPDVHKNALVVGDNKFIVTDTEIAAYAEYILFVVTEDGKYTFTAPEGSGIVFFVYTDSTTDVEWAITNPYVTNNGSADNFVAANLKAGVYMVVVNYYYGGVVAGEYNINVAQGAYEEGGNDVVIKNTIAVGENTYVLSESLKNLGYEFIYITVEEAGTYVFEGCAPLCFYMWPGYVNKLVTEIPTDAPYVWNVDNLTYELLDSFEIYLEAGTHCVGFRYDEESCVPGEYTYTVTLKAEVPHEHVFVDGKCECGAEDPNYVPPHEHVFVDGKCECGEEDPNYVPPVEGGDQDETPETPETPEQPEQPAPKLNFFQRIWLAIVNFFKSLFGKK